LTEGDLLKNAIANNGKREDAIGHTDGRTIFLFGRDQRSAPIPHEGSLPRGVVGKGPLDRFAAFGFVAGDGVIEGEFEAALGRIRDGINAIFEIQPTGRFALTIALEAAETLCR
jgi:hypothetical protein